MLCQSEGILSGSDFYFFTPSSRAREQLFYFTSIGHFFCEFGYTVQREDYGNYLLFLVVKGKISVTTNGKRYVAKEGELVFINCHLRHEYHAIGFTEFLWIHFDGSNTSDFFNEITGNVYGSHVFNSEQSKVMEQKLRMIISNYRYEKMESEYRNSLLIYELLIMLSSKRIEASEKREEKEKPIDDAIHYIATHISEDLLVSEIARQVGLSEAYFSRRFRSVMDSSPKEYIIQKRMNEAKHMLKTTSLAVKEIALNVGFNSESHFINTFTAQNGLSPKKFREFPI